MVNFTDYCENPSKYADSTPQYQQDMWNPLCDARNSLSKISAKQMLGYGDDVLQFGGKVLEGMIESLLTPEGAAMFIGTVGGPKLLKMFTKKLEQKALQTAEKAAEKAGETASEVCEDAATDLAEDEGGEMAANAMATTIAEEVGESAATLALEAEVMEAMVAVLGPIGVAIDVILMVQMIGQLIDAWDPLGFSKELSADQIDKMGNNFNDVFKRQYLSDFSTQTDEFNRNLYSGSQGWPVEYYADSSLKKYSLNKDGGLGTAKEEQILKFNYMSLYLKSLTVNSAGKPLFPRSKRKVPLPSSADAHPIMTSISKQMAGSNTVVENWFDKYFIFIVLLAIIFVIFIYTVK